MYSPGGQQGAGGKLRALHGNARQCTQRLGKHRAVSSRRLGCAVAGRSRDALLYAFPRSSPPRADLHAGAPPRISVAETNRIWNLGLGKTLEGVWRRGRPWCSDPQNRIAAESSPGKPAKTKQVSRFRNSWTELEFSEDRRHKACAATQWRRLPHCVRQPLTPTLSGQRLAGSARHVARPREATVPLRPKRPALRSFPRPRRNGV